MTVSPEIDCSREEVLDYLRNERDFVRSDIVEHLNSTPERRESLGLLIRSAKRISQNGRNVVYSTPLNNTKLRAGDEVVVIDGQQGRVNAVVDQNGIEDVALTLTRNVEMSEMAEMEVPEIDNLDRLIELTATLRVGSPGLGYLKTLAGLKQPTQRGLGAIEGLTATDLPRTLNVGQCEAIRKSALRPSLFYIQGTPGSGKTHILALTAKVYTDRSKDVVVMALTHQAVNNALNKIVSLSLDLSVTKLGAEFKNMGLDSRVQRFTSFSAYLADRRSSGHFVTSRGRVVGMTFQSAIFNLGMRNSAFMPQVILFDEAGQMPLAHAVAIGAFKCGSFIFIGDDAQMPPIFHDRLKDHPLSISVFEHVKRRYPEQGVVLDVTYRMNDAITKYVADRFYVPRGVCLQSDENATGNRLKKMNPPWMGGADESIEYIECCCPGSTDENPVEAEKVVGVVSTYVDKGLPLDRIAVITPYRRQVRLIHKLMLQSLADRANLPLIDTVERLQGQDVDVIVLSFAVDDAYYLFLQYGFIFNPNRLNVMFSRATSKVIVVANTFICEELQNVGARCPPDMMLPSNNA